MPQFFSKLKQGVSDVSKKAHNTVEAATLKIQLTTKEREIEKNYTDIGRVIYACVKRKESVIPTVSLQKYQQAIQRLEHEIEQMQRKLQQSQNLKECGCGKMLPTDATYCPFCGQQFHLMKVKTVPITSSYNTGVTSNHCTHCGTVTATVDQYCRNCGQQLN
ncbi:MAG TPA: zinc ribbon domain-containing protein [Paenibacillus sp.]|jgi:RNA polymerase subunit RPABC4/transcription elongation factor Spt4